MAKRVHDYAFTILRYDQKPHEDLFRHLTTVSDYLVFGFEVAPISGIKHIQGYIWFKSPVTCAEAKKHLGKSYVSRAQKSPIDNSKYCEKQNQNFPYDGSVKTIGSLSLIQSKYEALTKVKTYAMLNPNSKLLQ